jgi:hypothetical protein
MNTDLFDSNGKELTMEQVLEKIQLSKNIIPLDKVTRVEVIDANGRAYNNWDVKNKTEISMQDNGRTLKIFLKRV